MGVGEVSLGEEVHQDPDDIVIVFGLVPVHPGIQGIAAPGDLRVDEPAPIGVHERRVGNGDVRDPGQLLVPEAPHVRVVPIEASRRSASASALGHG